MQNDVRKLLLSIGEDPDREGLRRTPQRVEAAWAELTRGYRQNVEDVVRGAIFEVESNNMVVVRDIEIYSLCEHHLLPFYGVCHIGYIPRGRKVLGVSKLARIADIYARRLQVQERLTGQIARCIMDVLHPAGVGVVIEARHLCMMMRGVQQQKSRMLTSALLGCFQDLPATRNEFMHLIGIATPD